MMNAIMHISLAMLVVGCIAMAVLHFKQARTCGQISKQLKNAMRNLDERDI